ncbi:MAG: fumarylacetoacetate hydrolase family protein [Deltaproteobacteria bacterium]|nr:fumarylacetoacetate hydrolase family protein [Deltaproteobacteria bacterium]
MKICRYSYDGPARMGVVKGNVVYRMEEDPATGRFTGEIMRGEVKLLDQVKLLPPVTPTKIVAIGLNYKAHAAEFGKPLPETPMLFLKPSTAVIGHNDAIVYPSHMSHRVDYEGELAVVVGRKAKDVPVDKAQDYILGYTCINDVTARDLQGKDVQFTRAKGFDTFAPIGPWVETDIDPLNVRIETWLNGEKKQDTSTKDMIFNVYELFSFVSQVMTLVAGDVIATGTPSGIGKMAPGDSVEVIIEGIGTLKNIVAAR